VGIWDFFQLGAFFLYTYSYAFLLIQWRFLALCLIWTWFFRSASTVDLDLCCLIAVIPIEAYNLIEAFILLLDVLSEMRFRSPQDPTK
jgi:hypothetical protein